jgi:hypothetical protein
MILELARYPSWSELVPIVCAGLTGSFRSLSPARSETSLFCGYGRFRQDFQYDRFGLSQSSRALGRRPSEAGHFCVWFCSASDFAPAASVPVTSVPESPPPHPISFLTFGLFIKRRVTLSLSRWGCRVARPAKAGLFCRFACCPGQPREPWQGERKIRSILVSPSSAGGAGLSLKSLERLSEAPGHPVFNRLCCGCTREGADTS